MTKKIAHTSNNLLALILGIKAKYCNSCARIIHIMLITRNPFKQPKLPTFELVESNFFPLVIIEKAVQMVKP